MSICIYSKSLSVRHLKKIIPIKPSSTAQKGELVGKRPLPHSVWILRSTINPKAALIHHLRNIFTKLSIADLVESSKLPKATKIMVDIGVFFDGPMCTFMIPLKFTKLLSKYGIPLVVSCYPGPMDE